MASKASIVAFLTEQCGKGVTSRAMFGEYALYRDGKLFALICDDRLFVKKTVGGQKLLGAVEEGAPYPNAKPCFVVSEERWDDADLLAELAKTTADELPKPKAKKSK